MFMLGNLAMRIQLHDGRWVRRSHIQFKSKSRWRDALAWYYSVSHIDRGRPIRASLSSAQTTSITHNKKHLRYERKLKVAVLGSLLWTASSKSLASAPSMVSDLLADPTSSKSLADGASGTCSASFSTSSGNSETMSVVLARHQIWICHMTDHIPYRPLQNNCARGSGIDQFRP